MRHKPIVGNLPWWFGWYWKRRCQAVEKRMDDLEGEIRKLKGLEPLSQGDINKHNARIKGEN